MTGFEINTGGKSFPMSISDGILMINITVKGEESFIWATGIDNNTFENLELYKSKLSENDTVTVEVKEIEQSIAPVKIQAIDRTELLKKYHLLKQELKDAKIL